MHNPSHLLNTISCQAMHGEEWQSKIDMRKIKPTSFTEDIMARKLVLSPCPTPTESETQWGGLASNQFEVLGVILMHAGI